MTRLWRQQTSERRTLRGGAYDQYYVSGMGRRFWPEFRPTNTGVRVMA